MAILSTFLHPVDTKSLLGLSATDSFALGSPLNDKDHSEILDIIHSPSNQIQQTEGGYQIHWRIDGERGKSKSKTAKTENIAQNRSITQIFNRTFRLFINSKDYSFCISNKSKLISELNFQTLRVSQESSKKLLKPARSYISSLQLYYPQSQFCKLSKHVVLGATAAQSPSCTIM